MTDAERREPSSLVSVAGTDTDAAIADLAGMYAGRTWSSRSVDTDFWYRYVGIGDDQMSIRRSQMHGTLRGDVATEDEVVVQWIDSGSGTIDVGRDEVRMQAGVPALFPLARRFEFDFRDWDQRLVHLGRDLVLDVASEQYLVDRTLDFDRMTSPTAEAIVEWRRAVGTSVQALRSVGPESLAWHEAQRDVARALLGLYRIRAEPAPLGWGEHRSARVRAAVDFIHEHAHEPLTVSDVARVADLSVRGLQEAFQRTLDRSPMQYLREVRLRRAHEDLLAAQPGLVSVADVAVRWGFTHMGRFSGEYLRRFGEYPKRTLRR